MMWREPAIAFSGLVLCLGLAWPLSAQDPVIDVGRELPADPAVTIGELENGLRYYIRPNTMPRARAELMLVVNAGSVLEDEDQLGLAHFVEHMAFNGTEGFPRQTLVDYLESIGMRFGPDLNAFTGFDETVYMLQVPTDSFEVVRTAVDILEDWAWRVSFEPDRIETERGVIIEEWRSGRGAAARIRDRQIPVIFEGARYADRLPIGDPDLLASFEHGVLRRFYQDWYRPDLMAVIAVGDFDGAAIEALIQEYFSRIPARAEARPRPVFAVPARTETRVAVSTDPELTGSQVSVYHLQPARERGTVAEYRQVLVESLFNRMLNDRLWEVAQQADPPFLAASSSQRALVRASEAYILAARVRDEEIERGLDALLTEAERAARHGFTASELERQKAELLRGLERGLAERETTNSAAFAFEYMQHYLEGTPIPGIELEHELARQLLPSIGLGEVEQLARQWLAEQNRVVLVTVPERPGIAVPTEEGLHAVLNAVQDREIGEYTGAESDAPLLAETPEPGEITDRRFHDEVDVHEWRLENGARVLLKQTDFKEDEIVVRAWAPGGTSLADSSRFVSASFAAEVVLAGGLGDFGRVALDRALAGKAVSLSPFIGEFEHGLTGEASPRDLETLFELMRLYFTAAREDSTAFLSLRTRLTAGVANRQAEPFNEFLDTLQVTLSQYHFRARPLSSGLIAELDLQDALSFYRDRFSDASGFTFVFVGNVEPQALEPLVQRYIATLPATGKHETWAETGMRPPSGVVRKEVRRGLEPVGFTVINFSGSFDYSRGQAHVLRSLGEVLEIRLREALREEMGATYGVGVRGGSGRIPEARYAVSIQFGTAPERLEELTSVVFEQIALLREQGPSEVDMQKVREAQRRARETSLRRNSFWLSEIVAHDRYAEALAGMLAYDALIDELSGEQLRAAAQTYLDVDNHVQVSLLPGVSR